MVVFGLAIFLGAFLLFQVQPLIGKYILPWFGGTPAVWTACLLFFQAALVGGYAYAHLLSRWLKPRGQVVVHLLLLGAALFFLPIVPDARWKPSESDDPTWRILALLGANIGVPYLVLSATGPLFQKWFSLVKPGQSPYRLYALSNAGSLLALVSYPFLFEPWLSRPHQAIVWSGGLVIYAVTAVACLLRVWRAHPATEAASEAGTAGESARSSWLDQLLWVLLPACAVILLMATTNKLCQDVAVIPFLWVLPLALYLLSFILCFDNPQWYARKGFGIALLLAAGLVGLTLFEKKMPLLLQVFVYTAMLFIACMVCHGEVYRLKPSPRHLTYYYLLIAVGGAVGGALVALVAPAVFSGYFELHAGLLLLSVLLVIIHARERTEFPLAARRLPGWRAIAGATLVLAAVLLGHVRFERQNLLIATRNFYGALRVVEEYPDDPWRQATMMQYGEITHGVQLGHPTRRLLPLAYYHERTGVGLLFRCLTNRPNLRIGVIGLGTGTMSAYGRRGDVVRFYEINPAVKRLAEQYFAYLSSSTARVEIVMGDARLSMEHEAPQQYDVLVLDAFSSDAIPAHLLTSECFELYLRHLKPDGVIAAHVSNRHLDLAPVMDNLVRHFQLHGTYIVSLKNEQVWWLMPTQWYLMSRDPTLLNHPDIRAATAIDRKKRPTVPLWTDDYASLFRVLK